MNEFVSCLLHWKSRFSNCGVMGYIFVAQLTSIILLFPQLFKLFFNWMVSFASLLCLVGPAAITHLFFPFHPPTAKKRKKVNLFWNEKIKFILMEWEWNQIKLIFEWKYGPATTTQSTQSTNQFTNQTQSIKCLWLNWLFDCDWCWWLNGLCCWPPHKSTKLIWFAPFLLFSSLFIH